MFIPKWMDGVYEENEMKYSKRHALNDHPIWAYVHDMTLKLKQYLGKGVCLC